MQVTELRPVEPVLLDVARLQDLCCTLGPVGGETAIVAAMEDLAALLDKAGSYWRAGDQDRLDLTVRQVATVAHRIGMVAVARVAGDVRRLCARTDSAGLAAAVARLLRLGERSLLAVWDIEDLAH